VTLVEQINRDEGRRKTIYYDQFNIPTIGAGFNLQEGLRDDEIDYILNNRIKEATRDLLTNYPWAEFIDEVRRNAMLNMIYNMGIKRFSGFYGFLAAMEAKDWSRAKDHILSSLWHSQVPARSMRIATQVETGVMQ